MSANSLRWIMTSAGEPLVPAESGDTPGPDEAVVDIEACAVWCRELGYHFGDAHHASSHALRYEVSGHVVEAGANALYYTDRAVVLAVVPPKDSGHGCGFGAAMFCPGTQTPADGTDCRCGKSIIVPVCALYRAGTDGSVSSRSGRPSCNHR